MDECRGESLAGKSDSGLPTPKPDINSGQTQSEEEPHEPKRDDRVRERECNGRER
jgi:hypothetical protein